MISVTAARAGQALAGPAEKSSSPSAAASPEATILPAKHRALMPPGIRIEGHAIVSADGMIAGADGSMPAALRNDADWAQFQAALDQSALVVLGRLGHLRHPNPGRRRLVFTGSVPAIADDPADRLATLYNPSGATLDEALARLRLTTGTIAITGGQRVFDHFLPLYDGFTLAEVNGLVLPDGRPCFAAGHPRATLAAAGLAPVGFDLLDPAAGVTVTRWRRPGGR